MSTSRTIIVCAPAGAPLDWFTASEILDWHHQPAGTPQTVFPVRRGRLLGWISRWTERHLVQAVRRRGAVRHAPGGRVGRLDLSAAIVRANTEAVYRWRTWHQVVHNTPVARSWGDFLAQHKAAPTKVSMEETLRRFEAQPRILAMLAYNGHPVARYELDPHDLDSYQAGEATYAVTQWQRAIVGDALVTDDGRMLEPASDTLADKLRYMRGAASYLHKLTRKHQILALKVATQP